MRRTFSGTQGRTAPRLTLCLLRHMALPRRVPEGREAVKRRGEYGPAVCAARREERTASLLPVEGRRVVVLGTLLGLGWGQTGVALAAKKPVVVEVDEATLVLTAEAIAAREAAAVAAQEPDPEIAVELWTEAIEADPSNPAGWAGRGSACVQLRQWRAAADDLGRAVELYGTKAPPALLNSLGVARGQCDEWAGAAEAFDQARLLLRSSGEAPLPLPEPRGGANRLSQKNLLNLALARFQMGDTRFAVNTTTLLLAEDPAYWDARAARTTFLWAAGEAAAAEEEWAVLCTPSGPLEPGLWTTRNGTPDQRVAPAKGAVPQTSAQQLYVAPVAKITQFLTVIEAQQLSNRCEDYESGLELPCDDAGIPGMGGANEPCVLYSTEEVKKRLWPPRAVASLDKFLTTDAMAQAKAK